MVLSCELRELSLLEALRSSDLARTSHNLSVLYLFHRYSHARGLKIGKLGYAKGGKEEGGREVDFELMVRYVCEGT